MGDTLPRMEILQPCDQAWAQMHGTDRARYCDACGKTVLNFAAMSRREVELAALRAACGEGVCAQLTVRSDGEYVVAEPKSRNAGGFVGAVLGMSLMAAPTALAQDTPNPPRAVLTGRFVPPSTALPMLLGSLVSARSASDGRASDQGASEVPYSGLLLQDGTFRLEVPPGAYDIEVGNYASRVEVKGALLHAGVQSFGDIHGTERVYTFTTSGALASHVSLRQWLKHPVLAVRYVGRRIASGLRAS